MVFISTFISPMFYINYLTIYKVQMHANTCTIIKLLFGLCVCMGDNPLAKARGLSSHTDAQTIQELTHNDVLSYMGRRVQLLLEGGS